MLWLDDRGQSNKGGEVIGEGQIKEGDGTEAFTALSPSIDVAAAAAPAAEREVLIDRRAEATTAGEAAVVTVLANAAKGVPYPDAAAAVAMVHTSYVLVLFVEFGLRKLVCTSTSSKVPSPESQSSKSGEKIMYEYLELARVHTQY